MTRENDHPGGSVIPLAEARLRREASRSDVLAPLRQTFLEDLADLIDDYVEEVLATSGGDLDTMVEELLATLSTGLALAAEDHFEDQEDQLDFIDGVAEIAAELIEDDEQGDLFGDDDGR